MIAEPRWKSPLTHEHDPSNFDEVRVMPSRIEQGLYVECDIVHPPSANGRRVTLRIPPDKADAMLRALRDYGVDRRRL